MANTGYKKYNTLLRVVDGGPYDGLALDENGDLVINSGLPQDSKPNLDTDPDYIAPTIDYDTCPVVLVDVTVTGNATAIGLGQANIEVTLSGVVSVNVIITSTYLETSSTTGYPGYSGNVEITIPANSNTGVTTINLEDPDANVSYVATVSATPNPAGYKNIII